MGPSLMGRSFAAAALRAVSLILMGPFLLFKLLDIQHDIPGGGGRRRRLMTFSRLLLPMLGRRRNSASIVSLSLHRNLCLFKAVTKFLGYPKNLYNIPSHRRCCRYVDMSMSSYNEDNAMARWLRECDGADASHLSRCDSVKFAHKI
jgi:hypothetical protein